jgi:response regulator RpfG family c-di-GMP phosphodiesterase
MLTGMSAPGASNIPSKPLLVVDDEEIVLAALKETLRRAQYSVVTKSDPVEALEELKRTDFSVIITDQSMPTLTGLELLAQARQIQPFATRILITAVLSLDTVIDAINKGEIYRFIVKPWLREEFLTTVKNAVQRYELICQNAHLQQTTQGMNEQLVELNRSLEQQVKLVAHQNQQLADVNAALERSLVRSMELCLHTMETFYPALGDQARRTQRICRAMADVLQLSAEDRRALESSALLYDVGLIGVPRQIIKRWQETPDSIGIAEKTLIEQHPILGQEMVSAGGNLDKVGVTIRSHHENYDGSGYPDKLVGDNIPVLARYLSVAVAYASSGLSTADAVEETKMGAGSKFDPEAVRIFLRAVAVADTRPKEREVALADLRPGMVLARGIYTPNGLLLAPEGQRVNTTLIEKLLNHNRIQPITEILAVYC